MRTRDHLWILLALPLLLASVGCSGRNGKNLDTTQHSTYPHHYHDANGMPHPQMGGSLPPPHNHRHGPTWE